MSKNASSFIDDLFARFLQMSRAMRWATLAAIGLLLFVIWDRGLSKLNYNWMVAADRIESSVARVRANESVAAEITGRQTLITALGPVRVPTSVADGTNMFNDVILEVLEKHGIVGQYPSMGPRGMLPKTSLAEVTKGITRINRLSGDLKFDAAPDVAIAVIAELESSPYIDSINSLRLTRDGRKVKVALTLESWLLATDSKQGEAL